MRFQSPGLVLDLVLVLLLVLVPTECARGLNNEGPPPHVKPRYEKFHLQHIFGNMNEHKCNSEIAKREIYEIDGRTCKETNTFITASSQEVRKVCKDAGTPEGNLFRSNQPFPVITCKLTNGNKHQPTQKPNCEYKGIKSTRTIVIACDEGWPVHYDRDVVDLN
ncbi:ribonuclease-like 3 [Megalops cyprinoides]|uniref:ribonuclease-like 3 n=1 Tax=Megalops cyprinoides TaxID=118141 RepID=UPI001864079F|nr:ribonuclease-like 3 [Megalops cyprinoides]